MSERPFAAATRAFASFCATIAALRDKKTGCPWDLEQDHQSLRRYMLEEAYEAVEAMSNGRSSELCDELGDVLLQVVLNAQVAADQGTFTIAEVIEAIDAKMRRRHPHVFGDASTRGKVSTASGVRAAWEVIKAEEKGAATAGPQPLFADVKRKSPAAAQAVKIGKIAASIKFDWTNVAEVFQQVQSEVAEVKAELRDPGPGRDKTRLAAEIGDLYFSLAQLCRHLNLDPEVTADDANRKFLRRFARLEALAAVEKKDVRTASRDELEALWNAVKAEERSAPDKAP